LSIRRCFLTLFLLASVSADCQPASALIETQDRVSELRQNLTSGELPARSSYARQQLKQILAMREFAETMRGRSAWERWKQQLAAWFEKLFAALIGSIAKHPSTSQAIFWAAALGSLAVIAFQLFRLFRRDGVLKLPLADAGLISRQNTPEWIAAARSSAERGELSKAIQCVYWAAIAQLQSTGSLPKTAGLTPREFLRDLRAASASESLRSLTSALERFWFAGRPASADDFAACLRAVQGLGCKLD
jgi:Domain of unknown function (DUF4129)